MNLRLLVIVTDLKPSHIISPVGLLKTYLPPVNKYSLYIYLINSLPILFPIISHVFLQILPYLCNAVSVTGCAPLIRTE